MKNIVMLVLLAGAIGAGVYMMVSGDPEQAEAAKEETTTTWMCTECGEVVKLTAAEKLEWIKDPEHARYDPDRGGRNIVFKCPACGKYAVVRAFKCPAHKILFPAVDPETGVKLDCPKCVEEMQE